eukprot:g73022.t1
MVNNLFSIRYRSESPSPPPSIFLVSFVYWTSSALKSFPHDSVGAAPKISCETSLLESFKRVTDSNIFNYQKLP